MPLSESEIFKEFDRLAMTQIGFPNDFKALFFVGTSAKYITPHMVVTAFQEDFSSLTKKREKIIENFSRIEFLVDELIKIHVIGINHHRDAEFYSLYDKMGLGTKVKLLKEWKVLDNTLFSIFQKLIAVRNKVAHDVTLHDAIYNDVRIFSDRDEKEWNNFRADLQNMWGSLREIYRTYQQKEDWDLLLSQIELWQSSQ